MNVIYHRKYANLLSSDYISSQPPELRRRFLAVLQSVKQPHASAYLFALPNPRLNQVMSPPEFRCDIALHLLIPQFSGSRICSLIRCTRPMDSFGYHALCCPGRTMNHRHDLALLPTMPGYNLAAMPRFTVLVLLGAVVTVLSQGLPSSAPLIFCYTWVAPVVLVWTRRLFPLW